MRWCAARTVSAVPSGPVTRSAGSVGVPTKVASPGWRAHPYSAARAAYFSLRSDPTSLSLPATMAGMSTGGASGRGRPGNRAASSVTWRASAAASRALEGTHPVFTQVPPMVPRSIITTRLPRVVARIAAANAAPPDPITARSYDLPLSVAVISPPLLPRLRTRIDLPVHWKVKAE